MTDYLVPGTVEEACGLLAARPGAKALAGGTALTIMIQQGLVAPSALVDLERIPALSSIEAKDGTVRLGALVKLREVASSALVRQHARSLATACGRVGNVRIRNVATIGGNLAEADYASDPPAVLVSLDASCVIRGANGTRSAPVAEFLQGFYQTDLASDEIVTSIRIPIKPDRAGAYLKYVSRSSEDRPCVGVAVSGSFGADGALAGLSVVVGAVESTPQWFPEITSEAVDEMLDDAAIARVADGYADSIDPIEDARGSGWYRRKMVSVFVRRALRQLVLEGHRS